MRSERNGHALFWPSRFAFCLLTSAFCLLHGQSLLIVGSPRGEVFPDSLVRIAVAANPPVKFGAGAADSCALFRGPVAAGNALAGHETRLIAAGSVSPDSGAILFAFRPLDHESGKTAPQLGLGFHYLIASCGDGKSLSPEFPLWVATRQAATLTAPKAQESSSSPNFAWTPVPGVPAYHLLLSDQALDIDAEKGTVSGASIIWQAITTKSSIAYGTPDPSGNFSKVPAPPLSPNVPYNLVVLNNYDGRSSLSTSAKAQGLKLFTIQPSGPALQPARNVAPAADLLLAAPKDSAILFRWTRSKSASGSGASATANTYQVFIYSLETQDGLEVLFPIWHTDVTDTFAVLDAKRTLLTKRYIWKVFAMSETGASVVGDTTSFRYRNEVQTLSLTVRSDGNDPQPLGDVRIEVSPLDGSADALPLFTANTGAAEKVLAVGSYSLAFTKDGYLSRTRVVTLDLRFPLSLAQTLPAAEARITGRVADETGADLINASVTASGGGLTVTGISDAQGYFLLGVGAGGHAVSISKPDYQPRPDTTVSVAAGKSIDLGRLVLSRAQGSLSGTVANDKGVPLSGCQITIKSAAGALVRSLATDDKGLFSAFLAPGSYTVIAARTGFTTDQKSLRLTEAANLGFTLASGASLIKGRIANSFRPSPAASQSSPLPGAELELIDRLRGTSRKTVSDLRGEYSFSSDTGTFLLKASAPGKAKADSAVVRVMAARSTVIQDLTLAGFASVQGVLRLSPDTLTDPSRAKVNLLDPSTLRLVATAAPRAEPLPGFDGAMAFSVDGVPDGTYRLSCGIEGYGLDPEPVLSILNGVWKTGLDLTLLKSAKTLTVSLTVGGQPAVGTIRLIAPRTAEFPSGQKLAQAPSGTYALTAAADDLNVIPVSGYAFILPASGSPDTAFTLDLPFSHRPVPIAFKDGEAELVLEASARIDSAWVVFGYGAPIDTLRVPASQLLGPAGTRTIRFRPEARGGTLSYYFILKSGGLTYSNQDPARRFQAVVEASGELALLKLASGDSLRLASRTRGELHLHAYDAAGRRLDSAVDARGEFTWTVDPSLGIRLDRRAKRTLGYLTSTATAALPKGGAARAKGSARTKSGADWGALTATVSLDGTTRSLTLPIRVADAVIHKLVLTSTLGEVTDIPAPAGFGLFVSGYDTSTTPPTPVVPNAAITLDPPQAGSVTELQASLHPDFIGPLRILARQANADGSVAVTELGAARDSSLRGLNVGQTLAPGDAARTLFHDPLFEMRMPDSAFADKGQAVIRLYARAVAKTFSSGIAYSVSGSLYEISNPSGAVFTRPPRITLGLPPAARARRNSLQRFEAARLDFQAMSDSVSEGVNSFGAPALSADIRDLDGSYYGLLTASRGLTAGEVRIIPNPFSPLVMAERDGNTQYGARIRIHPESDRSSEVTLSVKVYNLDGELVRLLVDHKTVPKAPVDFYWDGRADGGRWARNGRYLVKIMVNATGSSKTRQILEPIVLFQ
jgi:carboxypeptidase family protein